MMLSFLKSLGFALQGLRFAWRGWNFRRQCAMAAIVTVAGIAFDITRHDWLVLILISGMVLSMEVMNTAIEKIVDLVSPEHHPLAGTIKDLAAGAVLLLSMISVIIGAVIFYPYVIRLL